MLYLSDRELGLLPLDWHALADTMERTLRLADSGDTVQPIKPYLRYRDPKNRIIAMPAYVGGPVNAAGIKWIASFPDNIRSGLPRAHSVIVLNDPHTGKPEALLNSPLPSIVRTAAVSALMIRHYLRCRPLTAIRLGIVGWGPIGRHHAQMAAALYGDRIESVRLYDLKRVDPDTVPAAWRDRAHAAGSWREVYDHSDIFITCTVAERRYVDRRPPEGALLLNVSLRDYELQAIAGMEAVVVDDWDEVCRENTDIELLHLHAGLSCSQTRTLADVVIRDGLAAVAPQAPVFFCPMGMAVFDIAAAVHFVRLAREAGIGRDLD